MTEYIAVESTKYNHNIVEVSYELTEDMTILNELHLSFRKCIVEVIITFDFEDEEYEEFVGHFDEDLKLVGIVSNSYDNRGDIINVDSDVITDYILTNINSKHLNLSK